MQDKPAALRLWGAARPATAESAIPGQARHRSARPEQQQILPGRDDEDVANSGEHQHRQGNTLKDVQGL